MEKLSILFIVLALISALLIFLDTRNKKFKPKMVIMTPVWVLSALWGGVIILFAYLKFGRKTSSPTKSTSTMQMNDMPNMKMDKSSVMTMTMMNESKPYWQKVALSTLHCGAGCALADIIGEIITSYIPISIIGNALFGTWVLDYILALMIGVYFQYSAIREMNNISHEDALHHALRADFWSLTAWQIGMYSLLSLVIFGFGYTTTPAQPQHWFIMQLAMIAGFAVSYPMNMLLIKLKIK